MEIIENTKKKKYQFVLRKRLIFEDHDGVKKAVGFKGFFVPKYEMINVQGVIEIYSAPPEEPVIIPSVDVEPLTQEEISELGLTGIYNEFRSLIKETSDKEMLRKYRIYETENYEGEPRQRLLDDIDRKLNEV